MMQADRYRFNLEIFIHQDYLLIFLVALQHRDVLDVSI
jgi:hypothetical protein